MGSCILSSHRLSILSNLLLTEVRKVGFRLRLKHRIFLTSYSGKKDAAHVHHCVDVGWPGRVQDSHNICVYIYMCVYYTVTYG